MRKIIASLDIGTDTIKLVVGEFVKSKLNILAVTDTPSKGIKKGVIVDGVSAMESIKCAFKRVEDVLGIKVTRVIISVPSYNADFVLGEGSSTITNPDRVVTGTDIVMAMQSSAYNRVPNEMELITVIPTIYKVDEKIVKNPKGMVGHKISVKSVVVMTPRKNVLSIVTILENLGIKILDIALGPIGDYYENRSDKTEVETGAIINIGDGTTTVSVFNKGVLTNTEVIDLGGQNIENDLIFIYKVNSEDAKKIKENLALCHKRFALASETMSVINKMDEKIKVNQYEISEIVMSRVIEILNLAKKQINHLTKKEISYIIVTGGLTEAKDFSLALEEVFGHNAIIGKINEIGVRNNKFSTSVGLVKYFNERLNLREKSFSIFTSEELEELVNTDRRLNVSENSILGKIFGYFFDN